MKPLDKSHRFKVQFPLQGIQHLSRTVAYSNPSSISNFDLYPNLKLSSLYMKSTYIMGKLLYVKLGWV